MCEAGVSAAAISFVELSFVVEEEEKAMVLGLKSCMLLKGFG